MKWHELMKGRERKEYCCCVKTRMEGVKPRSGETSEVLVLGYGGGGADVGRKML